MRRALVIALLCAPIAARADEPPVPDVPVPDAPVPPAPVPDASDGSNGSDGSSATDTGATSETIELVDKPPPGAETTVDEATLERTEYDDIHKVLAHVAGVYLRDEEGYGLRPNIGMRGAAAERSAKVALMEDGVLIAPAPYSAPAAYYFPIVTRMSRIDVTKGPSAIIYGPNTVGGAVNMIPAQLPPVGERAAYVDAALGSDLYGKLHARFGERHARWGVLGEYVKLRTDGFKQLDGGGSTGFDKDDASLWLRVNGAPTARVFHQLDLRAGYARETSDETYTGLTDADFARRPLRRYVGTQLDQMNWDHVRLRADHRVELGTRRRLVTTAYRHWFHRVWGKVDSFVGTHDFYYVISHPELGANPIFYSILTGAADSQNPEEELLRGLNDRSFVSQGVQTVYTAEETWGDTTHHLDAGVRLHHDQADRQRYEDTYRMMAGTLVPGERPQLHTVDSLAQTYALAAYAQDRVRWRRVEVSLGARVELLHQIYDDHLFDRDTPPKHVVDDLAMFIPGGGVSVDVTDEVQALAGVYRGFLPAAPSAQAGDSPELSWNYEAGARWRSRRLTVDAIGFVSDYGNLKATCSLAAGCTASQEGDQFDAGQVLIWGAEVQAAAEVALPHGLRLPAQLAYTWTRTRFDTSFESKFGAWGEVEDGDEMPYLPHHQLAVSASVAGRRWELGGALRWHGEARDLAGHGPIPPLERAEPLTTIDLFGHLDLPRGFELYGTVDNVLDEIVIVSRRPYGARPNAPRLFTLGCKGRF